MRTAIDVDHTRKIPISEQQRNAILVYLKRIKPVALGPGVFYDIYANKRVPTIAVYQDDNFSWGKELLYYFEKYGIVPPNEFLEKTFGWTV